MNINNLGLVSIIVPIYNTNKEFINECIVSILSQTYNNIEVIIIDDGSERDIAEYIDEVSSRDKRVRVTHQENKGIAQTRNIGIRMATGRYLIYVDSDDQIKSTFVEEAIGLIENNNADVAILGFEKIVDNNVVSSGYIGPSSLLFENEKVWTFAGLTLCERLINGIYFPYGMCVWGRVYRLDLIKDNLDIRFPILNRSEDQIFNLKIFKYIHRIVFANVPLYLYRQDNLSITRKINPNILKERMQIFDEIEKCVENKKEEMGLAFDNGRAQYLINICTTFLFHPECRENYLFKRAYLKTALNERHFKEGLSGIRRHCFSIGHYIYLLCLKYRMLDLALLVGWLGAKIKYKNQKKESF